MRALLLLLPLLCACALPDIDVPEEDRAARAEYPTLVPFGDVTGRAAAVPPADAELGPELGDRAEALRDRAGAIEAQPPDSAAGDRAARLRDRARALR